MIDKHLEKKIKCSKEIVSELSTLYQLCIRHFTIHFAYYYTETSVFIKQILKVFPNIFYFSFSGEKIEGEIE